MINEKIDAKFEGDNFKNDEKIGFWWIDVYETF